MLPDLRVTYPPATDNIGVKLHWKSDSLTISVYESTTKLSDTTDTEKYEVKLTDFRIVFTSFCIWKHFPLFIRIRLYILISLHGFVGQIC